MTLNDYALRAFEDARDAGWHGIGATHYERIALIHAEVSELLESLRRGGREWVEVDGKPEGPSSEIADILIRTLELACWVGVDVDAAVTMKMAYNRVRADVPVREGGKEI